MCFSASANNTCWEAPPGLLFAAIITENHAEPSDLPCTARKTRQQRDCYTLALPDEAKQLVFFLICNTWKQHTHLGSFQFKSLCTCMCTWACLTWGEWGHSSKSLACFDSVLCLLRCVSPCWCPFSRKQTHTALTYMHICMRTVVASKLTTSKLTAGARCVSFSLRFQLSGGGTGMALHQHYLHCATYTFPTSTYMFGW